MCGRFTQERATSELAEVFAATDLADDPGGRFNVAPTDEAAVIVQRDSLRAIVRYRWGLVPHWAADVRDGARRINARAETLGRNPAFRDAFVRRRCVVPVDSFYEWRRRVPDDPPHVPARRPFRIVRRDRRPLALAGLWAGRRSEIDGSVVRSFTIVTTVPNRVVGDLHDRMPVVLPDEAWSEWLDPSLRDLGQLTGLLVPAPDDLLAIHAVSPLVNSVRNDGPELIAPVPA